MSTSEHESNAPEHESNRPRGLTIQISGPWAEEQGPDAERRYAEVIAKILETEDLRGEDLAERIRTQLDQAGLIVADQASERLAEQLRMAEPGYVSILDSHDRLLFGQPDATPLCHDPGVDGAEDPASPDRPLYT